MNVEEVKHLIEMRKNYPPHKAIINAKLFTEGLDILINEIERLNNELKHISDNYGSHKSKHEILYNVAHELTNRKLGCDLAYYGEEGIQELITELDQISQITRDMSINLQTTGYAIKHGESEEL